MCGSSMAGGTGSKISVVGVRDQKSKREGVRFEDAQVSVGRR